MDFGFTYLVLGMDPSIWGKVFLALVLGEVFWWALERIFWPEDVAARKAEGKKR